jgi:hypothetical protein
MNTYQGRHFWWIGKVPAELNQHNLSHQQINTLYILAGMIDTGNMSRDAWRARERPDAVEEGYCIGSWMSAKSYYFKHIRRVMR